jgi:hypothetical protein
MTMTTMTTEDLKAKSAEKPRTVVLLVNVLEKDHTPLSAEEVLDEMASAGELSDGVESAVVIEVRAELAKKEQRTPRSWRAIARAVERGAAELRGVKKVARYVVCGRAPLAVFAALGRCLERLSRPVTLMSVFKNKWERIELSEPGVNETDHFTAVGPLPGAYEAHGRALLVVHCMKGIPPATEQVMPALAAAGEALMGGFGIVAPERSKEEHPLVSGDLVALNRHVEAAQAWLGGAMARSSGLVVTLLGPAWVAFWLGMRLNRRAFAGRVDFWEFDADSAGYVPALSSPRHEMPWLAGRPKLLFLEAEPDGETRTLGKVAAQTIAAALANEPGIEEQYELRARSGVTPQILRGEIEAFKPDILHIHMHGSRREVLAFEDEQRGVSRVAHDLFVRALKSRRLEPTLVVLSACHSAAMASALAEVAECVISMRGEVKTKTAVRYAHYLYTALAAGRSLKEVLERASVDVALDGMPGYEVIERSSAFEDELDDVVLFRGRRSIG